MLGNRVAVSPIVTVEPRRRKFHKPITLTIPVPQAATRGMINQYSGDTPTLRLLCSITGSTKSGGTAKAQWEDVTGSTPLTFVNNCVSFTTTVSARFWLMDCRQVNEATKFATDLYREAISVPFMSKFVVFCKRHDPLEAQMRVFCMTDDKEDKTLENQEHFAETAKSRDVEVLEGKPQYLEFAGNLVPVTKSGEQLSLTFQAFRENRLPFLIRVRDPSQEPVGKIAFMKEPRKTRGEPPQVPICNLEIKLPDEIVEEETIAYNDVPHQTKEAIQRSTLDDHEMMINADPSIMRMGQDLGKDWIKVASHLNLSPNDVDKIKAQFPNQEIEQAIAMLYARKRQGSVSQDRDLCKALWEIGRKDLITKYYPDHNRHLAEFGIKLNGKLDDKEIIRSSKSLPLDREVALDDKDIMKDAESMEESEGESVGALTGAKTNLQETRDEERATAVKKYLQYLEEEDREDSEERAAFRGEKAAPNELYILKEEIQVPSGNAGDGKSPTPHEAKSHVNTEESVEFTDDGGLTHTITQVTKTTVVQEVEEPVHAVHHSHQQQQPNLQQQPPESMKPYESETWQSGEQDTSQVSVSSLPEDEKSEPTTAVSSTTTTTATTTTGDNAVSSRITSVNEEPGTKITVEQNGVSGTATTNTKEDYQLIAENILRQVYDEVFELIRTKKITLDDKEWFETEASGDVIHIIEQKTTCERNKDNMIEDENYDDDEEENQVDSASLSYSEKKDIFVKLSEGSKVNPMPITSHYQRTSSVDSTGSGASNGQRRPSEGEIVETVGGFHERRAYFESTGRRSYSIDTANLEEARQQQHHHQRTASSSSAYPEPIPERRKSSSDRSKITEEEETEMMLRQQQPQTAHEENSKGTSVPDENVDYRLSSRDELLKTLNQLEAEIELAQCQSDLDLIEELSELPNESELNETGSLSFNSIDQLEGQDENSLPNLVEPQIDINNEILTGNDILETGSCDGSTSGMRLIVRGREGVSVKNFSPNEVDVETGEVARLLVRPRAGPGSTSGLLDPRSRDSVIFKEWKGLDPIERSSSPLRQQFSRALKEESIGLSCSGRSTPGSNNESTASVVGKSRTVKQNGSKSVTINDQKSKSLVKTSSSLSKKVKGQSNDPAYLQNWRVMSKILSTEGVDLVSQAIEIGLSRIPIETGYPKYFNIACELVQSMAEASLERVLFYSVEMVRVDCLEEGLITPTSRFIPGLASVPLPYWLPSPSIYSSFESHDINNNEIPSHVTKNTWFRLVDVRNVATQTVSSKIKVNQMIQTDASYLCPSWTGAEVTCKSFGTSSGLCSSRESSVLGRFSLSGRRRSVSTFRDSIDDDSAAISDFRYNSWAADQGTQTASEAEIFSEEYFDNDDLEGSDKYDGSYSSDEDAERTSSDEVNDLEDLLLANQAIETGLMALVAGELALLTTEMALDEINEASDSSAPPCVLYHGDDLPWLDDDGWDSDEQRYSINGHDWRTLNNCQRNEYSSGSDAPADLFDRRTSAGSSIPENDLDHTRSFAQIDHSRRSSSKDSKSSDRSYHSTGSQTNEQELDEIDRNACQMVDDYSEGLRGAFNNMFSRSHVYEEMDNDNLNEDHHTETLALDDQMMNREQDLSPTDDYEAFLSMYGVGIAKKSAIDRQKFKVNETFVTSRHHSAETEEFERVNTPKLLETDLDSVIIADLEQQNALKEQAEIFARIDNNDIESFTESSKNFKTSSSEVRNASEVEKEKMNDMLIDSGPRNQHLEVSQYKQLSQQCIHEEKALHISEIEESTEDITCVEQISEEPMTLQQASNISCDQILIDSVKIDECERTESKSSEIDTVSLAKVKPSIVTNQYIIVSQVSDNIDESLEKADLGYEIDQVTSKSSVSSDDEFDEKAIIEEPLFSDLVFKGSNSNDQFLPINRQISQESEFDDYEPLDDDNQETNFVLDEITRMKEKISKILNRPTSFVKQLQRTPTEELDEQTDDLSITEVTSFADESTSFSQFSEIASQNVKSHFDNNNNMIENPQSDSECDDQITDESFAEVDSIDKETRTKTIDLSKERHEKSFETEYDQKYDAALDEGDNELNSERIVYANENINVNSEDHNSENNNLNSMKMDEKSSKIESNKLADPSNQVQNSQLSSIPSEPDSLNRKPSFSSDDEAPKLDKHEQLANNQTQNQLFETSEKNYGVNELETSSTNLEEKIQKNSDELFFKGAISSEQKVCSDECALGNSDLPEFERLIQLDGDPLKKVAELLISENQINETMMRHSVKPAESVEISSNEYAELADNMTSTQVKTNIAKETIFTESDENNEINEIQAQDKSLISQDPDMKRRNSELIENTNHHDKTVIENAKINNEKEKTEIAQKIRHEENNHDVIQMRQKVGIESRFNHENRNSADSDQLSKFKSTSSDASWSPEGSRRVSCDFDHFKSPLSGSSVSLSEYESIAQETASYMTANQADSSDTSYATARSSLSRDSTVSVDFDRTFDFTEYSLDDKLMFDDNQTPLPENSTTWDLSASELLEKSSKILEQTEIEENRSLKMSDIEKISKTEDSCEPEILQQIGVKTVASLDSSVQVFNQPEHHFELSSSLSDPIETYLLTENLSDDSISNNTASSTQKCDQKTALEAIISEFDLSESEENLSESLFIDKRQEYENIANSDNDFDEIETDQSYNISTVKPTSTSTSLNSSNEVFSEDNEKNVSHISTEHDPITFNFSEESMDNILLMEKTEQQLTESGAKEKCDSTLVSDSETFEHIDLNIGRFAADLKTEDDNKVMIMQDFQANIMQPPNELLNQSSGEQKNISQGVRTRDLEQVQCDEQLENIACFEQSSANTIEPMILQQIDNISENQDDSVEVENCMEVATNIPEEYNLKNHLAELEDFERINTTKPLETDLDSVVIVADLERQNALKEQAEIFARIDNTNLESSSESFGNFQPSSSEVRNASKVEKEKMNDMLIDSGPRNQHLEVSQYKQLSQQCIHEEKALHISEIEESTEDITCVEQISEEPMTLQQASNISCDQILIDSVKIDECERTESKSSEIDTVSLAKVKPSIVTNQYIIVSQVSDNIDESLEKADLGYEIDQVTSKSSVSSDDEFDEKAIIEEPLFSDLVFKGSNSNDQFLPINRQISQESEFDDYEPLDDDNQETNFVLDEITRMKEKISKILNRSTGGASIDEFNISSEAASKDNSIEEQMPIQSSQVSSIQSKFNENTEKNTNEAGSLKLNKPVEPIVTSCSEQTESPHETNEVYINNSVTTQESKSIIDNSHVSIVDDKLDNSKHQEVIVEQNNISSMGNNRESFEDLAPPVTHESAQPELNTCNQNCVELTSTLTRDVANSIANNINFSETSENSMPDKMEELVANNSNNELFETMKSALSKSSNSAKIIVDVKTEKEAETNQILTIDDEKPLDVSQTHKLTELNKPDNRKVPTDDESKSINNTTFPDNRESEAKMQKLTDHNLKDLSKFSDKLTMEPKITLFKLSDYLEISELIDESLEPIKQIELKSENNQDEASKTQIKKAETLRPIVDSNTKEVLDTESEEQLAKKSAQSEINEKSIYKNNDDIDTQMKEQNKDIEENSISQVINLHENSNQNLNIKLVNIDETLEAQSANSKPESISSIAAGDSLASLNSVDKIESELEIKTNRQILSKIDTDTVIDTDETQNNQSLAKQLISEPFTAPFVATKETAFCEFVSEPIKFIVPIMNDLTIETVNLSKIEDSALNQQKIIHKPQTPDEMCLQESNVNLLITDQDVHDETDRNLVKKESEKPKIVDKEETSDNQLIEITKSKPRFEINQSNSHETNRKEDSQTNQMICEPKIVSEDGKNIKEEAKPIKLKTRENQQPLNYEKTTTNEHSVDQSRINSAPSESSSELSQQSKQENYCASDAFNVTEQEQAEVIKSGESAENTKANSNCSKIQTKTSASDGKIRKNSIDSSNALSKKKTSNKLETESEDKLNEKPRIRKVKKSDKSDLSSKSSVDSSNSSTVDNQSTNDALNREVQYSFDSNTNMKNVADEIVCQNNDKTLLDNNVASKNLNIQFTDRFTMECEIIMFKLCDYLDESLVKKKIKPFTDRKQSSEAESLEKAKLPTEISLSEEGKTKIEVENAIVSEQTESGLLNDKIESVSHDAGKNQLKPQVKLTTPQIETKQNSTIDKDKNSVNVQENDKSSKKDSNDERLSSKSAVNVQQNSVTEMKSDKNQCEIVSPEIQKMETCAKNREASSDSSAFVKRDFNEPEDKKIQSKSCEAVWNLKTDYVYVAVEAEQEETQTDHVTSGDAFMKNSASPSTVESVSIDSKISQDNRKTSIVKVDDARTSGPENSVVRKLSNSNKPAENVENTCNPEKKRKVIRKGSKSEKSRKNSVNIEESKIIQNGHEKTNTSIQNQSTIETSKDEPKSETEAICEQEATSTLVMVMITSPMITTKAANTVLKYESNQNYPPGDLTTQANEICAEESICQAKIDYQKPETANEAPSETLSKNNIIDNDTKVKDKTFVKRKREIQLNKNNEKQNVSPVKSISSKESNQTYPHDNRRGSVPETKLTELTNSRSFKNDDNTQFNINETSDKHVKEHRFKHDSINQGSIYDESKSESLVIIEPMILQKSDNLSHDKFLFSVPKAKGNENLTKIKPPIQTNQSIRVRPVSGHTNGSSKKYDSNYQSEETNSKKLAYEKKYYKNWNESDKNDTSQVFGEITQMNEKISKILHKTNFVGESVLRIPTESLGKSEYSSFNSKPMQKLNETYSSSLKVKGYDKHNEFDYDCNTIRAREKFIRTRAKSEARSHSPSFRFSEKPTCLTSPFNLTRSSSNYDISGSSSFLIESLDHNRPPSGLESSRLRFNYKAKSDLHDRRPYLSSVHDLNLYSRDYRSDLCRSSDLKSWNSYASLSNSRHNLSSIGASFKPISDSSDPPLRRRYPIISSSVEPEINIGSRRRQRQEVSVSNDNDYNSRFCHRRRYHRRETSAPPNLSSRVRPAIQPVKSSIETEFNVHSSWKLFWDLESSSGSYQKSLVQQKTTSERSFRDFRPLEPQSSLEVEVGSGNGDLISPETEHQTCQIETNTRNDQNQNQRNGQLTDDLKIPFDGLSASSTSKEARSTDAKLNQQQSSTSSTLTKIIMSTSEIERTETELSIEHSTKLKQSAESDIKKIGSGSGHEPDSLNLVDIDDSDHLSPMTKPSPPEIVDIDTADQVISPVIDYPSYLTPDVQVKVGVSPTEEIASRPAIDLKSDQISHEITTTMTKTAIEKTETTNEQSVEPEIELESDVALESVENCAFINSAFEGAEVIDAREESIDGAVSPFEVTREDLKSIQDPGNVDLSTRPSDLRLVSTSPTVSEPISETLQSEDSVMRQLDAERVVHSTNETDLDHGDSRIVEEDIDRGTPNIRELRQDSYVDFEKSITFKTQAEQTAISPTISEPTSLASDEAVLRELDAERIEVFEGKDQEIDSARFGRTTSGQQIGTKEARLHSASEIKANVVVWETTIHQHSIDMSDEVVGEMTSSEQKVRLEERVPEEPESEVSEQSDSTSLKKEARILANEIVDRVKEEIQSRPIGLTESVEISDEDLVEMSDEPSTAENRPETAKEVITDEIKVTVQTESAKEISGSGIIVEDEIKTEKVRIEKTEISEIVVGDDGQKYLVTETKTTEERTRSETIRTDEFETGNDVVVKMRRKTGTEPNLNREHRISNDSDRLGASLSSTPSSDRKFMSALSDSSRSAGSSRPASSEFDHLISPLEARGVTGSGPSGSEYETAATSQGSSSYMTAAQATSGDTSYATAKSSQGSRESTISVDSEGSVNITEFSSETSETLITGAGDNRTPIPEDSPAHKLSEPFKSESNKVEDDDDDSDDGSSTPINHGLSDSVIKEPYEAEISEDIIRSGIEIPFMSGNCNWEMVERPVSSPSSPFEVITSSEIIRTETDLVEETTEMVLGEAVTSISALETNSIGTTTISTLTANSLTTTANTVEESDQHSLSHSDGSATWLSSSLGTAVGLGNNSFDSSTGGGQASDRPGGLTGPTSGLTDSMGSFEALGQSSDNLGSGDAMSSLESQGQMSTTMTTTATVTTAKVIASSPSPVAGQQETVSGSELGVEIDSSFGDYSPGLLAPEAGREPLGGSLSSVNDINEIPSEAAATDTPLISQSSIASSVLSEQTRHQLSYDLSPEIPCHGSGIGNSGRDGGLASESLTMRSDDTQLSDADVTRPMSPIPPNDFGSNAISASSLGNFGEEAWEKSPCSDDTDMCLVGITTGNDIVLPLTGNLVDGLYTHEEIDEEIDDGSAAGSSGPRDDSVRPTALLGLDRSKPIPVSGTAFDSAPARVPGELGDGSSTGSSLQEFEKLEAEVVSRGTRPSHHGSSDSIGSFGSAGRPVPSKVSQGDDVSVNSLSEFEKLELECRHAEVIEKAAREEAARLSEIEEGHESQASDSQETLSDPGRSDDSDDYEKRMNEIDEMLNVSAVVAVTSVADHLRPIEKDDDLSYNQSGESTESSLIEERSCEKPSMTNILTGSVVSAVSVIGTSTTVTTTTSAGRRGPSTESGHSSLSTVDTGSLNQRLRDLDPDEGNAPHPGLSSFHEELGQFSDLGGLGAGCDLMTSSTSSFGRRTTTTTFESNARPGLDIDDDDEHSKGLVNIPSGPENYKSDLISSTDSSDHFEQSGPGLASGQTSVMSASLLSAPLDEETIPISDEIYDQMRASFISMEGDEGQTTTMTKSITELAPGSDALPRPDSDGSGDITWTESREIDERGNIKTVKRMIRSVSLESGQASAASANDRDARFKSLLESKREPGHEVITEERAFDEEGALHITRSVEQSSLEGPFVQSRDLRGPHAETESASFIETFKNLEPSETSETIETIDDLGRPVRITKSFKMTPEVRSISFSGPDASGQLETFLSTWSGDRRELTQIVPQSTSGQDNQVDSEWPQVNSNGQKGQSDVVRITHHHQFNADDDDEDTHYHGEKDCYCLSHDTRNDEIQGQKSDKTSTTKTSTTTTTSTTTSNGHGSDINRTIAATMSTTSTVTSKTSDDDSLRKSMEQVLERFMSDDEPPTR